LINEQNTKTGVDMKNLEEKLNQICKGLDTENKAAVSHLSTELDDKIHNKL
jgi:hypothetical protein